MTSPSAQPNLKPRRRVVQFSLRTFFILLTLFAVWFGWAIQKAREQKKAVAWVRERGGSVRYDYEGDVWTHTKMVLPEFIGEPNRQPRPDLPLHDLPDRFRLSEFSKGDGRTGFSTPRAVIASLYPSSKTCWSQIESKCSKFR
jgi:hypothetical protein